MKPTSELLAEHKAVLLALQLLERVTEALEAGKTDAPQHLEQLLEFFQVFVDRCHHGKEENVLFPELEKHGLGPTGGPVAVMLAEHEGGREHIRDMAAALEKARAGDRAAVAQVRKSVAAYSSLLRDHIQKENNVLFPMADRLVVADAAVRVLERFEATERDRVGEQKHEAFHDMLDGLKKLYRVE